jgi:hypothetical protein
MAAQEASAARTVAAQLQAEIAALTARIEDAIPRILSGLEASGYPDGRLLTIGSTSHGVFRKRSESVEIAGWLFYSYRNSDHHSEDYLLSDGRILSFGSGSQGTQSLRGPYRVSELGTMWEPEQVLHTLKLMWDGGPLAGRGLGGHGITNGPTGIQGLLHNYGSIAT